MGTGGVWGGPPSAVVGSLHLVQEQLVIPEAEPTQAADEPPVEDWCAWCFAPAEEGPIVNRRRYCSGGCARKDTS